MTLAAALAVLVMMAALATAHPAQHKLHQVEILNFDVHSFGKSILDTTGGIHNFSERFLEKAATFPLSKSIDVLLPPSAPGAADELQPAVHPDAEHLRRAARHHEGQPPQGTVHK